jgi:hypothetical protein
MTANITSLEVILKPGTQGHKSMRKREIADEL